MTAEIAIIAVALAADSAVTLRDPNKKRRALPVVLRKAYLVALGVDASHLVQ
jgi:hypothetical protein